MLLLVIYTVGFCNISGRIFISSKSIYYFLFISPMSEPYLLWDLVVEAGERVGAWRRWIGPDSMEKIIATLANYRTVTSLFPGGASIRYHGVRSVVPTEGSKSNIPYCALLERQGIHATFASDSRMWRASCVKLALVTQMLRAKLF
jgi:hypothetical protein